MKKYIKRIEKVIDIGGFPSRLRFMLLDTIDVGNTWYYTQSTCASLSGAGWSLVPTPIRVT
jgi:hypothetical protein